MIELKHLRTVQALADVGSVQLAAEILCVTQSAVSHQLKELEHRLGTVLFERKTQPLQFSAAGQLLLQLAQDVLPAIDQACLQLKSGLVAPAQLRLSVECHACFHWLLPAITHFNTCPTRPQIEFEAVIEHNAIEALLQQQLDVVLTSDKRMTGQVSFFHLFDMELRVLLSPAHALADKAFITAQDLSQQLLLSYPLPAVRQDLFRYFLDINDFKGRLRQVEQGSQILQLVAAGQGISVLPSWMAQPFQQQGFIVSKSLGETGLWRPMYLACRLAEQHCDAITALTDSIRRCTPVG